MSASSRTVQATPGMGQLIVVFAALLAGTALIVALAYGQLTASQARSPRRPPRRGARPRLELVVRRSRRRTPTTGAGTRRPSSRRRTPYSRGWGSTAPAIRRQRVRQGARPRRGHAGRGAWLRLQPRPLRPVIAARLPGRDRSTPPSPTPRPRTRGGASPRLPPCAFPETPLCPPRTIPTGCLPASRLPTWSDATMRSPL